MENILLQQLLQFVFLMNTVERMIPKPLQVPKAKAVLGNNRVKTQWFVTNSHSNQKCITRITDILPSPLAAHKYPIPEDLFGSGFLPPFYFEVNKERCFESDPK